MTSVDSNFNFLCGRPYGAGLPLSTCVHLSQTPPRVDVINGWPLCSQKYNFKSLHYNVLWMFKEMPLDNVENLWNFEFIFMWFGNILQYVIVSNCICCPSI